MVPSYEIWTEISDATQVYKVMEREREGMRNEKKKIKLGSKERRFELGASQSDAHSIVLSSDVTKKAGGRRRATATKVEKTKDVGGSSTGRRTKSIKFKSNRLSRTEDMTARKLAAFK